MWPFNKEKRDINQLIFDNAEYNRDQDMRELIDVLKTTEIFAPVASGVPNVPHGTLYTTTATDRVAIMTVRINDMNCVAFFTDGNDTRLQRPCISMTGEEAMKMVLNMKADGLLVQNNKNSYFGLDAQGIRDVLTSNS